MAILKIFSLQIEIMSDEEAEEEEVISLSEDKYRPQSLEKMIHLIATLVEKSRGEEKELNLHRRDYNAILTGKVRTRECYRRDHCQSVYSGTTA